MRTKLLLLVVFALSNTLFAQNVGDYRSAGPGPADWHTPASWQVWNGSNWVAATNYPGEIDGTYDVEIINGHLITMQSNINNLPNTFGTLTINGEIRIFNNQVVFINATTTVVTQNKGIINFIGNADLHFPENMVISVFPGGLYPPDDSNGCNASKRIWIGTILFSSCNGNGPTDPISFWELMQANGNLLGIITAAFADCNQSTYNVTLTSSYLGLPGTDPTFTWTINTPDNITIESTSNPYILDLNIEGTYEFILTYTTEYGNGIYTNVRNVVYENNLTTWTGSTWTKGAPTIDTRAIIAGNYNGPSFSACFLKVNSNATLSINSDKYVEVAGSIQNDGNIVITENGSLVQIDNNATFTGNGTNNVTRTSRQMKANDYVYWGSPIEETFTLNSAPNDTYFYRFFKWNLSGTQFGTWGNQITQSPAPGNGFIARVKASYIASQVPASTIASTQFVFNGNKLNTGTINVNANVYGNSSTGWQTANGNTVLLGNPYPSAISAAALVNANSDRLMGTLFFWTSVTVFNSTGNGQYNVFDYATWNSTGDAIAPPASAPGNTSLTPQGYIASGQGFFAQVFVAGDVVFNNSMRVRDNNAQFFRMAEGSSEEPEIETERHRIWVNLSNGKDAYRQLLMGYIEGATNDFDYQYDGASFTTNEIDIYTLLENKELAIQGRALPFVTEDIIPLGYRITNPGIYAVNLGATDGLFAGNQEVYLYDKTTKTLHNLKKGAYEFQAQAGTYNDRFEIRFSELSKESNPIVSENTIQIFGANGALHVNSYGTNIQSIEVFDLLGKRIFSAHDINNGSYVSSTIKTASPFFIARVTLANNQVISKKIIIQ